MSNECRVNILADTPTSEDLLGTLEPVVGALSSLIDDPKQKGGKTILLEGTWGSGKSSVVKKLRDHYSKRHDTAAIIFDAWGHQGDPLRRSFLECLIRHLRPLKNDSDGVGWLNVDTAEGYLAMLSGQSEKSRTKTRISVTFEGFLIGALLLLVPVGVGLLIGHLSGERPICGMRLALAAMFLAGAPSAALVCFLVRCLRWRNRRAKHPRLAGPKPGFAHVTGGATESRVESLSIRSGNPTSVEFCEIFAKVAAEALGKPERKLVLVVDNLDRVAKEDALALWSTMRSLFEEGNHPRPDWLDRVWLLVPMDRDAAARLWQRDGTQTDSATADGEHFLAKTFQAHVRVPYPVLTNWEDLLRKKLVEAIPCCASGEAESSTITRLFDLLTPDAPSRITPRLVIQFVNRLAALHASWKREIPLTTQAAYALREEAIRKNPHLLVTASVLEPTPRSLLNQEWCDSDFARMYYGIADHALVAQELLFDPIAVALGDCDKAALDGMKVHEWFSDVIESVVARRAESWAKDDAVKLTNAALALAHLDPNAEPTYPRVWSFLGAERPARWLRFGEQEGLGLVEIMKRCTGDAAALVPPLVDSFCGHANLNIAAGTTDLARAWLHGALAVVRYLAGTHQEFLFEGRLKVPSDAPFYIRAMAALLHEPNCHELAPFFIPTCRHEEVTGSFARQALEGKLQDEHRDAAQAVCLSAQQWDWLPVVNAVQKRISERSGDIGAEEADACTAILTFVGHSKHDAAKKTRDVVKELVGAGHVALCLQRVKNADRDQGAARCAYAFFEHDPNPESAPGHDVHGTGVNEYRALCDNPQERPKMASYFAFLVKSWMPLPTFFAHAKQANATPLVKFVLNKVCEDQAASERYFSPDAVLTNVAALREFFGEHAAAFLKELPTIATITSKVATGAFAAKEASLYTLLLDVYGSAVPKDLAAFLLRGIENLSKDDWMQELSGPSSLTDLAAKLTALGIRLPPRTQLSEALTVWADQTAAPKGTRSTPSDSWMVLLACLPETEAGNVLLKAKESALGQGASPDGRVLVLRTIEPRMDTSMAGEVVRYYTTNATRASTPELNWLSEAFGKALAVTPADAQTLRSRVSEALADRQTHLPTRPALDRLGKAIDAWLQKQASPELR